MKTPLTILALLLIPVAGSATESIYDPAFEATLDAIQARRSLPRGPRTAADESRDAENEKKYPIPSGELTKLLRDKGIGVTMGYGQTTRTSARFETVQLRYNIFQREATAFNNRAFSGRGADRSKLVTYGGQRLLSSYANYAAHPGEELSDNSDLKVAGPIVSGVYLWAGWTDKEVVARGVTSKPILAGFSVGFGPLEKGAATIHLDAGLAFYSDSRMPKDDIYIGFSVDVELFKKIAKGL